ncbi:phosphocholine cytidylyltransferase family protein [Roseibium album]|uniref:phosphocholine cytidylyltransferase family protein n=1 Tax=Roseibium album TaxID=311410 RepID=UPI00248F8AD2|nr:phosphocholine cytidylyltransferase family protein [Roseibium album]
MKAIILAAGRGSRMKGLTDDRPKCLVELEGKPLLDRQIQALGEAGCDEIAIVTGYRRDQLMNRGLVEFSNERWSETNMVSSLACAEDWLQSSPCIVSYSDIFFDAAAPRLLMESISDLAITYDPNWLDLWSERFQDPLVDAETFKHSSANILTEIGNTPKSVEEVQGQYMGLLRFTPSSWAEVSRIRASLLPELRDKMHMTGTLQQVIKEGRIAITALPYSGVWGEIDSEDDLSVYRARGLAERARQKSIGQ